MALEPRRWRKTLYNCIAARFIRPTIRYPTSPDCDASIQNFNLHYLQLPNRTVIFYDNGIVSVLNQLYPCTFLHQLADHSLNFSLHNASYASCVRVFKMSNTTGSPAKRKRANEECVLHQLNALINGFRIETSCCRLNGSSSKSTGEFWPKLYRV